MFSKLATIVLIPIISAQSSTYSISSCVGSSPVTAFPNCNYLYDTLDLCAGPTVNAGADYIACMCNQALFNSYFGCESEDRLCFGNDDSDPSFQPLISQWHSICDGRTTAPITTPPISSISASCDPDFYSQVNDACQTGVYQQQQCHSSYASQPVSFSSCFCQPAILSLDYTCLYLQNVSCFSTPAALTNMVGVYPYCKNLLEVLGNVTDSSNATTTDANSLYTTVSFSAPSNTATATTNLPSPVSSQIAPTVSRTASPSTSSPFVGSSQIIPTASTKSSLASELPILSFWCSAFLCGELLRLGLEYLT